MSTYRLFSTGIVLAYIGLSVASCCARSGDLWAPQWREAVIAALFAASNWAIFLWTGAHGAPQ
jgi:hypothetical protein